MKVGTAPLAAILCILDAHSAGAHHSFAMFANDKTITMSGTVKQFEWINPHAWIHIITINSSGKPEEWHFEMGSLGQLGSRGWAKDSVMVGDKITITAHPMKDGSHGGSEMSVITASGQTLGGHYFGQP
jgi:hypothetical protein